MATFGHTSPRPLLLRAMHELEEERAAQESAPPRLAHGGGSGSHDAGDGGDFDGDDEGDESLADRAIELIRQAYRELNVALIRLSEGEIQLQGHVIISPSGSLMADDLHISAGDDDDLEDLLDDEDEDDEDEDDEEDEDDNQDDEDLINALIDDLATHLDETSTTVAEAAEGIGRSPAALYGWLSGRTTPSPESAMALVDYLEEFM
jgi:hypothetical protein